MTWITNLNYTLPGLNIGTSQWSEVNYMITKIILFSFITDSAS